jgi:hypothetical protein
MEIGGYTGWGVWLIVAVFAFNLTCIPLWFLLNHLQRTHSFELKRARTFLELLGKELKTKRVNDGELNRSLQLVRSQLESAEGRGPLWGRKELALARLGLAQVSSRYPELCEAIDEAMQLPWARRDDTGP